MCTALKVSSANYNGVDYCSPFVGTCMLQLAGAEASHMHKPDDENYTRGYEWWIMTEAKKVGNYCCC